MKFKEAAYFITGRDRTRRHSEFNGSSESLQCVVRIGSYVFPILRILNRPVDRNGSAPDIVGLPANVRNRSGQPGRF